MSKYTKLSIGDTFIIRWMDDNRTYDAGLGEIVYVMDSDNFKIDLISLSNAAPLPLKLW